MIKPKSENYLYSNLHFEYKLTCDITWKNENDMCRTRGRQIADLKDETKGQVEGVTSYSSMFNITEKNDDMVANKEESVE